MKHIEQNRLGDMGEHYATTWLWDKGYEVFKNSGCTGPIDMIAIDKKGKPLFIDVKTAQKDMKSPNLRSKNPLTEKQKKLKVKILLFNPDTRELRFTEHKT